MNTKDDTQHTITLKYSQLCNMIRILRVYEQTVRRNMVRNGVNSIYERQLQISKELFEVLFKAEITKEEL